MQFGPGLSVEVGVPVSSGLGVALGFGLGVALDVACSFMAGFCAIKSDKANTMTETMHNPAMASANLVLSLLGDDVLIF